MQFQIVNFIDEESKQKCYKVIDKNGNDIEIIGIGISCMVKLMNEIYEDAYNDGYECGKEIGYENGCEMNSPPY